MDQLFATLAVSGASLVSRAAFSYAQSLAVKQISSIVQQTVGDKNQANVKLARLQPILERKLAVITPAIDIAELLAAKGNTTLDSVLVLCGELRRELTKAANTAQHQGNEQGVQASVVEDVERVIGLIDELVPYLQLALQVSGAHVGTRLPSGISASRLLQASNALTQASNRYVANATFGESKEPLRIGETFPTRVYTLFQASARAKGVADWTWKEDHAKAQVSVERVPPSVEYLTEEQKTAASGSISRTRIVYELVIVENLNDGRYHEEMEGRDVSSWDVIPGRTRRIKVSDLRRLYYSHSGKLLNIDGTSPVLVVKVAPEVIFTGDGTPKRAPDGPIEEWIAFELSQEEEEENNDTDDSERDGSEDEDDETYDATKPVSRAGARSLSSSRNSLGRLSILEYILKLSALEMSEQKSHLDICDEKVNLYLMNEQKSSQLAIEPRPLSGAGPGSNAGPGRSVRPTPASGALGPAGIAESPLSRKAGGGRERFIEKLMGSRNEDSQSK
ncbi:hypothetical protein HDU85_003085 [Gaertneriomyces sp. JEL0708]|nr:hypothetical protein HDU85_003085 [Gaertneriomyces sp. JEL0708]